MNGLFIVCLILMNVSVTAAIAVICYYKGRLNERQAWNDYLALPERTPANPHFTAKDIGMCIAEKVTFGDKNK